MTLHQLRIFECVVRHLNITKASAVLHISQPSVSQQLKLLEEEFRTKFFIRLNQGVELTPEGEEFFTGIRPLLTEAENLEKRFKNSPKANDTAPLIAMAQEFLQIMHEKRDSRIASNNKRVQVV